MVKTEISDEYDGHMAIVDGYTGTLYLDPEEELQSEYEIRRKADMKEREELLALRKERTITRDGREVALLANIGNLDDLNSISFTKQPGSDFCAVSFSISAGRIIHGRTSCSWPTKSGGNHGRAHGSHPYRGSGCR